MTQNEIPLAVGKVLANPRRIAILELFRDRELLSPNEARKQLNDGLTQVSYHFKVLKGLGMIEQQKTEPRRGAVEHFYCLNADSPLSPIVLGLLDNSTGGSHA